MAVHPHILVLGCNFAGLTTARYIREFAGEQVKITCIDRKPYLSFIPNIPIEVWNNNNPATELHLPFIKFLDRDKIRFIQGDIRNIDVEQKEIGYIPAERPGSASENISYDYLVIALGNHLAFDKIEGFAEHGHTFTDTFYGDEIRRYLHEGGYKGGPIAIGSDRFIQGKSDKLPEGLPVAEAACEGPPVEVAFSLADWLQKRGQGGAENITLFTPAEVIAEDAGEQILDQLLPMMQEMGYGYKADTKGISKVHKDGIEFKDGSSVEAELKIIFPNWEGHSFLKNLPISDDQGFIITDMYMRNPDYPEVFAVGDAASITVPKLGSLGHMEAEVLARVIGQEVGNYNPEGEIDPMEFMLICMGDMGSHKGFYMHTDEWWGGDTSILKMGYTPHMLKMGFKSMYYTTGGKIPSWGLPLSEFIADRTVI
ncbi:FAD-dependent oxidoreductase [Aliifodinibius salicampi]|uniref:FAD-dependent oxidoreductase n=1 Tax=Fodinibius salicampi TaxID=1920655 RepID=A0ABT3PU77_9BACT|nr:FAD-dependent oxidoreductase [Fodinibius salicampi]MCW9711399.1 FAD-dependent oxidoreductase [Fodinibius salicampi]